MNSSTRILVTVIAAAALAAAVAFFVILPMRNQAEENRAAIAERQGQLTRLQRVAQRINDLNQEVARLESALAFFENRLPQQREIDVIVREVSKIAEATALTTRSIRTTAGEDLPRYNSQPITMTLEGPFNGFYEFLLGIEQLPRITKVRQIQISKVPLKEGVVQAELLMDIFYEKPK